jgi:hypothetical protein
MGATIVRSAVTWCGTALLLSLGSCASGAKWPIPGEQIAALKPLDVCLTLYVPGRDAYHVHCGAFDLGRPSHPHDLQVPREWMEKVLHAVADAATFTWVPATSVGLPDKEVQLRLYGDADYQCSLGTGPDAAERLERVSAALRGRQRFFINDAIGSLRKKDPAKP